VKKEENNQEGRRAQRRGIRGSRCERKRKATKTEEEHKNMHEKKIKEKNIKTNRINVLYYLHTCIIQETTIPQKPT
jgi:hypothetical protein